MIDPSVVVERVCTLPALSAAAVRLHGLARDPRSSVADFEAVIRLDPGQTYRNRIRFRFFTC